MNNLLLIALTTLTMGNALAADNQPTIDSSHSFLTFEIGHLGIGKAVGQFSQIEGTLDPEAGVAEITVRADSLNTFDAKRDEHLRGPDFFNVKQFPVLRFTAEEIVAKGNGSYQLTGTLLIHGRKQELTVTLHQIGEGKDPWGNYRKGYETSFTVKRSDFGMNYMADILTDEVRIHFVTEVITG